MFSHSRYLTFARKITLSTMCCGIKLLDWQCRKNSMIRREINRCLNGLTTSFTDDCLLKMNYSHSLKRKPEFSKISIDDCINTLQIISGHMSHLISLESIELCCWLVEETWIMALYRCQFFSAMSKYLGLLTLRRMTDWGTPISNHENACWNVYACFFERLVLQGVTRDRNNCTLNKTMGMHVHM